MKSISIVDCLTTTPTILNLCPFILISLFNPSSLGKSVLYTPKPNTATSEPISSSAFEKNLPFSVKEVRRRIALLRREYYDSSYPLDSLLQATPAQLFELHGLNSHDDYFCAGLIMLDRRNFDDLAECYAH